MGASPARGSPASPPAVPPRPARRGRSSAARRSDPRRGTVPRGVTRDDEVEVHPVARRELAIRGLAGSRRVIPSTAISVASASRPVNSGATTRPLAELSRRSRSRSPGRTFSRVSVRPFTVSTLPQRPSCARSWRVLKRGIDLPVPSSRQSSMTHITSRLNGGGSASSTISTPYSPRSTCSLLRTCGMEPEGPRVLGRELVDEGLPRLDRRLRGVRNAVHRIGKTHAVPVDRRLLGKPVGEAHPQRLSEPDAQLGPGNLTVVGPDLEAVAVVERGLRRRGHAARRCGPCRSARPPADRSPGTREGTAPLPLGAASGLVGSCSRALRRAARSSAAARCGRGDAVGMKQD